MSFIPAQGGGALPDQAGNANKFLKTDGTDPLWATPAGGGDMETATYDPRNIDSDAFDCDNHTSGTTNKVFTGTEQTKLAGIETGADVTDAANVASTIHGVSSKGTPVDNDEVGLIDSEASNVLKRTLWSAIKSTLKTYFDTIYGTINAFVGDSGAGGTKGDVPAPAAGDAAAGKFLKADGTWETPAGGSLGGSTGSTDNTILAADGTGGSTVKAGGSGGFPKVAGTGVSMGGDGVLLWDGRARINTSGGDLLRISDSAGGLNTTLQSKSFICTASTGAITPPSNTAGVRAKDDPAELYAFDENGTETLLTPHAKDAPAWLYDQTPGIEHVTKSYQHYLGTVTYVQHERAAVLAGMLDAEKAALTAQQRTTRVVETFAEHNVRLGLTGDKALVQKDWDVVQAIKVAEREQEIAAMEAEKAAHDAEQAQLVQEGKQAEPVEFSKEIPAEYEPKPAPEFLRDKEEGGK